MLVEYAKEQDIKVKDRMMLIIKIERDQMPIYASAKSLEKSSSWGYKWYARYINVGFHNLSDMPRSGRPCKTAEKS